MKDKGWLEEEIRILREDIKNLPDHEREEGLEQLSVLFKALGAKDELIAAFEKVAEPTPPTSFAAKVRRLEKLDAEYNSAKAQHSDNPQRLDELKQIYDKERARITDQ